MVLVVHGMRARGSNVPGPPVSEKRGKRKDPLERSWGRGDRGQRERERKRAGRGGRGRGERRGRESEEGGGGRRGRETSGWSGPRM
eukprot:3733742-Rhodomonas_salina.1